MPSNIVITIAEAYVDECGNGVSVLHFDCDREIIIDRDTVYRAKQDARRAGIAAAPPERDEPRAPRSPAPPPVQRAHDRDDGPVRPSDAYRKDGGR